MDEKRLTSSVERGFQKILNETAAKYSSEIHLKSTNTKYNVHGFSYEYDYDVEVYSKGNKYPVSMTISLKFHLNHGYAYKIYINNGYSNRDSVYFKASFDLIQELNKMLELNKFLTKDELIMKEIIV